MLNKHVGILCLMLEEENQPVLRVSAATLLGQTQSMEPDMEIQDSKLPYPLGFEKPQLCRATGQATIYKFSYWSVNLELKNVKLHGSPH